EPNTAFAANPPPLPDDDSAWAMQDACQLQLAAAGFGQYEVSAYARAGRECVHNLNYWNFGDYLGLGAGAHGKTTDTDGTVRRRWKVRAPRGYLEHAATPRRIGGDDAIAHEQLPFEFMLNALRLNAGFGLADFSARTGLPESAIAAQLAQGQARGWIERAHGRIRATELGQRFLNDVIELFLPDKPAPRAHGGPPHD
ncbi:MAG: radical SAM family heme chaperone HemW, partial [Rudaea sp.]